MKKILIVFESRASYGYSKNLYNLLKDDKNFNLKTVVTGTHLSKELGSSINHIKKDNIKIDYKIPFLNKNFNFGIGNLITKFSKILKEFSPDIVLIFGDRVELMAIAISCSYNPGTLLAHVQAGDKSGHIDDMTRMALSKLCHIHFPATKKAKQRLIKLGEEKNRIHLVGAPQLDDINYKNLSKKKEIYIDKRKISLKNKYIVILQHPVFKDQKDYHKLFEKTLRACAKIDLKKYVIYPNYDPGYKLIIKKLNKLDKKKISIFKNINRQNFLTLVSNSSALVGNSSAGILESPSLKIGVVNIGDRQNLREQNKNIFNAKYDVLDIHKKLIKAIKIKNKIKNIRNIHGDGKSSQRIFKVLKNIKISKNLLTKKTTY